MVLVANKTLDDIIPKTMGSHGRWWFLPYLRMMMSVTHLSVCRPTRAPQTAAIRTTVRTNDIPPNHNKPDHTGVVVATVTAMITPNQ